MAPSPRLAYSRALLKVSGEGFAGGKSGGSGIDFAVIDRLTDELKAVAGLGVQLGLVVGGGNILRGTTASQQGMDRVSADYMGMLATVINALALQDILEKKGVDTRVMTAIRMEELAEPYIRRRAVRHLEKGRMVIFAGVLAFFHNHQGVAVVTHSGGLRFSKNACDMAAPFDDAHPSGCRRFRCACRSSDPSARRGSRTCWTRDRAGKYSSRRNS